ncbi:universal stress protein [Tranquillimonas alkanivorans]|uniref:Universal stress protein family protein n=1 Tax=Tranquillimonas alkanivorans TaxID=441119 RepID=A0A1I5V0X0_9RHOB|nr:universal stress protein [Tranquillimonas alkanivorans]SFQ01153.1 Universal stress protein family protein [Tranquillimonas alkanivorans]
MSIKNILVAHTGSAAFPSSLRHAVQIAVRHDAWLTALYGNTSSYFDQVLELTGDMKKKLSSVRKARIEDSRRLFEAEVEAAGMSDRSRFLEPEDVGNLSPSEVGRHFDFVVTGFHPNRPADEFRAVSPDIIALQSGRPVLVVPDGYTATSRADHALVAWDGKRAAARALNDSMFILEEKPRKVSLVTVGNLLHDSPQAISIKSHLERHGIEAEHISLPEVRRGIAGSIQKTANEIGAKLIVMGAYEHSKFSQDIFGGVTHEVVRSTSVPVFMSH